MTESLNSAGNRFGGNNFQHGNNFRSNSGGGYKQNHPGQNKSGKQLNNGATSKNPDYCWRFNRGGFCKFGNDCRYINRCSYCDAGNHGRSNCPKKLEVAGGNVTQQSNGGNRAVQNGGVNTTS